MKKRIGIFLNLILHEGFVLLKTYIQSILFVIGYLILAGMTVYGWSLITGEPLTVSRILDVILYAPFVLVIGYLLFWGVKKLWKRAG